jgi:hypothetical protein
VLCLRNPKARYGDRGKQHKRTNIKASGKPPHQQAEDMTAPEYLLHHINEHLIKERRPDMTVHLIISR